MPYAYKHIVIVHGIGDQAPNETALGFMNEFIRALPQDEQRTLTVHNLIESVDHLTQPVQPVGGQPQLKINAKRSFQPANIVYIDKSSSTEHVIGFSEVYWQPITNAYIEQNDGHLPVPIFTWARSISARLLTPGYDFAQWRAAIENLETMLGLLNKLAIISKKSELFTKVTKKFLGDVQMYAESDEIRLAINRQFIHVMGRVQAFASETARKMSTPSNHVQFESIKIYVVAHSEGTVVAYNSLVQEAMVREGDDCHVGENGYPPIRMAHRDSLGEGHDIDWLVKVAGLVTLGSPLDKHFFIWRSRFRKHLLKKDRLSKIPWFNFADKNDPVAYELTELKNPDVDGSHTDAERMFDIVEHSFQRYPMPGKAHIDYWTDRAIHEKIIYKLMCLTNGKPSTLDSAWWAHFMRVGDYASYAMIRVLLFLIGLFFMNRLLHTGMIGDLSSREALKRVHEVFSTWPIDPDSAMLNMLNIIVWLLVPVLLMKLLVEGEKWEERLKWLRWILATAWFAIAFIVCLYWSKDTASSGILDIVGYGMGLFATVLLWKLYTSVHRGLIQLWRYTRVV